MEKITDMKVGEVREVGGVLVKYDGAYDWIPGDGRQWTVMSHYIDSTGRDQFKNSIIGAERLLQILGVAK